MHRVFLLMVFVSLFGYLVPASAQVSDSVYTANHPRLLFSASDVPALAARVTDGGADDDAYTYVRDRVQNVLSGFNPSSVLNPFFGINSLPEIGIVAHIEADSATMAFGRSLTTYLADTYDVDLDEALSGTRLRALAMGYDLFFAHATPSERGHIVSEIVSYLSFMTTSIGYAVFEYPPYLANHSAMFAAGLGLAAIALDGEADSQLLADAMAQADRVTQNLLDHQFDDDGAYKEGALYTLWTLRNLVYYFDARKRFDGTDYGAAARLRAVAEYLAYELLPEGSVRANNINDSNYNSATYAIYNTYFDWSTREWGSGIGAWLWEHSVGPYGLDMQYLADKSATILWYDGSVEPTDPNLILPPSKLFRGRGLFYYRSGWPTGAGSNDAVFSFFSGPFYGGHAQEDQNGFTFRAFGEDFVIDHGSGSTARQSEAHNMVFIDGAGQHNAGNSIGTDGEIVSHLLSGFADYIVGDAAAAYATYSPYNAPDQPFPGIDWSWGYSGANPVLRADRHVVVVHDTNADAPYVLLIDDIDKDGFDHDYEWRMHTRASNQTSIGSHPFVVSGDSASMLIHVLHPTDAVAAIQPFDNGNSEPNSTLLTLNTITSNPWFTVLLLPFSSASMPAVDSYDEPWGSWATVAIAPGISHTLVVNHTDTLVTAGSVETDARVAVIAKQSEAVSRFLMAAGTRLVVETIALATIDDGLASVALSDGVVSLDRANAAFRVRDLDVTDVTAEGQPVPFYQQGGNVVAASIVTGAPSIALPPGIMQVTAYPNPFNPATTIRVSGVGGTVRLAIFDVAGRRVAWRAIAVDASGVVEFKWDGSNDDGQAVVSGVYLVRVSSGAQTQSHKIVLMK